MPAVQPKGHLLLAAFTCLGGLHPEHFYLLCEMVLPYFPVLDTTLRLRIISHFMKKCYFFAEFYLEEF